MREHRPHAATQWPKREAEDPVTKHYIHQLSMSGQLTCSKNPPNHPSVLKQAPKTEHWVYSQAVRDMKKIHEFSNKKGEQLRLYENSMLLFSEWAKCNLSYMNIAISIGVIRV